jgi:pyruvate dehydrogenase (quinone)/pyruvate oxidase
MLSQGKRTVLMVGAGALNAREEVIALAQKLKAPVVKALLGKAVIPDDHPLSLGGIGLLGTAPAEKAMDGAEVLLMVGTCYPFGDFLPEKGRALGIQIDIKGEHIGLHYPVAAALIGDSKATLRELTTLVKENDDDAFLRDMQAKMKDWWALMASRATRTDYPLRPQAVAWTLSDLLDDDAIICSDSGTITTWAARYIKIRGNQAFSLSGRLASMANGLPYAVGAQTAYPGRQVVAFVGDGGFTMLMCEFLTAVAHNLPIKVVLIKNGYLGQIRWEQIGFLGNPEYGVKFQNMDFVKFAEACGGTGYYIDEYEKLRPRLASALAEKRPTLVEVAVDPDEPPYPAQLSAGEVANFAKALAKGEPRGKQIALTMFRDKLREV